jgi:excisionase family DNA binding protein
MVARLLGVSAPTVVNWVNSGILPAHRTPGGHRRIAVDDLRTFAQQHHYPLPPALGGSGTTRRASPQPAPAPTPPAAVRVLVVDDQRDFCSLVRDYLTFRGGYEVEIADSGFAAGFAVARFRPDVIVMDILMPDMDGFEVLRMLQADAGTRSIPVVACTAYWDPRVEERVKREAFVAYVEKPAGLDRLAEVIGAAAGRRSKASSA